MRSETGVRTGVTGEGQRGQVWCTCEPRWGWAGHERGLLRGSGQEAPQCPRVAPSLAAGVCRARLETGRSAAHPDGLEAQATRWGRVPTQLLWTMGTPPPRVCLVGGGLRWSCPVLCSPGRQLPGCGSLVHRPGLGGAPGVGGQPQGTRTHRGIPYT